MAEILPVLLGGDLNSYNIARAFYECYGIKSYVFGRYAVSATKFSSFVTLNTVRELHDRSVLSDVLFDFSSKHVGASLVVFGCTDNYVQLLIDARENGELPPSCVVPHPTSKMRDMFAEKSDFYAMCGKYRIPTPETLTVSSLEELKERFPSSGLSFPVVVKPSSSAEYWFHPFEGMRKVYFIENADELYGVVGSIFASGYTRGVIVQEMIGGGSDKMRVLTTYSDRTGRVRMASLGHVMLEEPTPHGIGNHSAIITAHDPALTSPFREMLDGEGYTGFCNFDIKYDEKSGRFLALDMNLRQGRSNFYVTTSGANIAELAVRDLVFGEELPYVETDREIFWHSIPRSTVYKYTADKALVSRARRLDKDGRSCSSLFCSEDTKNPLRLLCVLEIMRRERNKYSKYCKNR